MKLSYINKTICLFILFFCFCLIGCSKPGSEREFQKALKLSKNNNYSIEKIVDGSYNGSLSQTKTVMKIDGVNMQYMNYLQGSAQTFYYQKDGDYYCGYYNEELEEKQITYEEYEKNKFKLFDNMEYSDFQFNDCYELKPEYNDKYFSVLYPELELFKGWAEFEYHNFTLLIEIENEEFTKLISSISGSYKIGEQLITIEYHIQVSFYDYGTTVVAIPE